MAAVDLTREQMLTRIRARDKGSDGCFITGVLTTGIYCLPSCPARPPKADNIRFFAGIEEARAADLRPCKRCRPDDFYNNYDPDLDLVQELVARIRRAPAAFAGTGDLAREAGVGITKLNNLFRVHLGNTPARVLQAEKVGLAQRLLARESMPLTEVAAAAGFESNSVFHHQFKRLTFMTPAAFRDMGSRFELFLPDGYRTADPLLYLGRDGDSPCERVEGQGFCQALGGEQPRMMRVDLESGRARVALSGADSLGGEEKLAIHRRLVNLLGLRCDPEPLERALAPDSRWARLVGANPGARLPHSGSVFEGLVWAVIGQQINLAFAYQLRQALVALCGVPVEDMIAHPDPARIAQLDYDQLTQRRYSRRKAEYLIDLARLVADGKLDVEGLVDEPPAVVEARLTAIRGIGLWTARYTMLRACAFGDSVPVGDAGVRNGLRRAFDLEQRPDNEQTLALMAPTAPHRGLATYHLWLSL